MATGVASYVEGDILGVAVDMDTRAMEFFKNGSSVWTGTASATFDTYKDGEGGGLLFQYRLYYSSSQRLGINNGQMPFLYTPPDGYKALQTNNLAEPTIKDGSDHFQTLIGGGAGTFKYASESTTKTTEAY